MNAAMFCVRLADRVLPLRFACHVERDEIGAYAFCDLRLILRQIGDDDFGALFDHHGSRQTVRRVVRAERSDMFRVRMSSLEPWLTKLDQEWNAGCHNGAELWRRLKAAGLRQSACRDGMDNAAPAGGSCPKLRPA